MLAVVIDGVVWPTFLKKVSLEQRKRLCVKEIREPPDGLPWACCPTKRGNTLAVVRVPRVPPCRYPGLAVIPRCFPKQYPYHIVLQV